MKLNERAKQAIKAFTERQSEGRRSDDVIAFIDEHVLCGDYYLMHQEVPGSVGNLPEGGKYRVRHAGMDLSFEFTFFPMVEDKK